jgi:acyl carrier protein phosphodiesterase
MNYLAHLFLAGPSAESLIGNLAGDFVKGPLREDQYTPGIRAGIRQHRAIDAFTDTHPEVAAFRRVLIPDHGHYSRVISDVFLDYFLANGWSRYSDESLDGFLQRVFATIDPHQSDLPGRLRLVYPHMRDGAWFLSYREVEGIRVALTNLSRRLSRQPHLEDATHHLIDSRLELERRFQNFFPDVVAFAQHQRDQRDQRND